MRAPTSGWRAPGIDNGIPSTRPAEVIGSCTTTQPPASTLPAIRATTADGSRTCSSRNRQNARSTGSGSRQVLGGLGDGEHLAVGGRGAGDLVAGQRIAVDRVDPAGVADDLGEGDGDVAAAGADVDAAPAGTEAEAFERGGQRAAVDVVAQAGEGGRRHVDQSFTTGPPLPIASAE